MLNWVAINQDAIANTIFSQIDDENVHDVVDFSKFQDAFALAPIGSPSSKIEDRQPSNTGKRVEPGTLHRAKGPTSVLDMNRARNLGIATRRIGDVEDIIEAIDKMDMSRVSAEKAELLRNEFLPTKEEIDAITARMEGNQKIAPLDEMLFKLSQVARVKSKLTLMMNIESVQDIMKRLSPAAEAVIVASTSLMSSKNLKKLFEVILAYGNLMNSSRRGGVWGFKLSVFDRLITLKTKDKSMNLMHYVVMACMETEKLNDVMNFRDELVDIDAASAVSLQALKMELNQSKQTVQGIKRELEAEDNQQLKDILEELEPQVDKAAKDLKEAEETYKSVTTFYCEPNIEPTSFFSIFNRVKKAFTDSEKEVIQKKRQEAAMAEKARQMAAAQHKSVRDVLDTDVPEDEVNTIDEDTEEPSGKRIQSKESNLTKITTVEDGTIDDIMQHMKKEAFRRPEGQHKKETRRRMSMRGGRPPANESSSFTNARPWLV